jgi:predicted dehydrogenase
VRIGLVGCGRLAEAGYLPAIALAEDCELAAVADPDRDRREIVAGSLPAFSSAESLIAAGGIDAVVIASPPTAHRQAAERAADAGLPALVEKPPAPDHDGAARLAELDPAPWIGFNRRYTLGAGLAGVLSAGGTLEMELRYRRFSWAPVSVRDPALLDLAPHLIDLALRSGLGSPVEVSARSSRPERVELNLALERGRATIRCACDRFHRERLRARGPDGTIVHEFRSPGLVSGLAARAGGGPHPLVRSLADQLADFAKAVRSGEPSHLATANDGARVMAVVAAAATSLAREDQPVAVAPA